MAVGLLNPFLRLLRKRGRAQRLQVSTRGAELLAQSGIAVSDLAMPHARVPHRAAIGLMRLMAEELGDPALAFYAGLAFEADDGGVHEYAARSAPSLLQGLETFCKYMPLLHDGCEVQFAVEEGGIVLRHRLLPGVSGPRGAHAYAIAAFSVAVRRDLRQEVAPLEVHFMQSQPPHADELRRGFGAELRFDREWNALVLPRGLLDAPMAHADAGLHAELCRYAEQLLALLPSRAALAQRVTELMRRRLASARHDLASIAESLHMSERSLRRKLAHEGTSHSELLDVARKELALSYLSSAELDLSEIGFRLGFAHPPAFHRAFRRWYGISPSEYRKRHAGSLLYRFFSTSGS